MIKKFLQQEDYNLLPAKLISDLESSSGHNFLNSARLKKIGEAGGSVYVCRCCYEHYRAWQKKMQGIRLASWEKPPLKSFSISNS